MKKQFRNHIIQNIVAVLMLALSNVVFYQFGSFVSNESDTLFSKKHKNLLIESTFLREMDDLLQDFSMTNNDVFVTKNPQLEQNHLSLNLKKLTLLKHKISEQKINSELFNQILDGFHVIERNNLLMLDYYKKKSIEESSVVMAKNDAKISEVYLLTASRLRQINSEIEKIVNGHLSEIKSKRIIQVSFFIWSFFSIVIILWVLFGLINSIRTVLYENNVFMHSFDRIAIFSITDLDGNITYVNDFFCQVSGFERDELIGKNHRLLNSGTHSSIFFQNIWTTISKGDSWRGRICNRRKDGGVFWVDAQIIPTYDEKGVHNGYSSTRLLVDSQIDLEQKMSVYQKELDQQSKYRLANIVMRFFHHDFNNSLQAIELHAHNMANEEDSTVRKNTSNKILELGHHASEYLTRIGKFSQDNEFLAEGQLYFKDLIQDVTFFIGQRLHRYEVDLLLSGEYHNLYFYCHPVQVLQAFLHLMFETFEKSITASGARYISIEFSEMKEGKLTIKILNNNGVGTYQENQSQILSHFNNARQILEDHQCLLTVQDDGEKTYFQIEISLIKKPV